MRAFAFLQSRGILTRKMGGYGLPQHLRITIGTGEEMETGGGRHGRIHGRRDERQLCSTGSH